MRKLTATLIVLAATALVLGCSDKAKDDAPPPPPPADTTPSVSQEEALIGTWAAGNKKVAFRGDGTYVWDRQSACPAEPCPMARTGGKYELRRGSIYLTPASGSAEVIEFKVSFNPKQLWMKSKSGGEWTLPAAQ